MEALQEKVSDSLDDRLGGFYEVHPAERPDAHSRSKFHPSSILSSLHSTALRWFPVRELRLVLSEIRNCYHRIVWQSETRHILRFDLVEEGLPVLQLREHASPTEKPSYIEGIQALERERPWLTLVDFELYVQGWLQAEKCLRHSTDTQAGNSTMETRFPSPISPPRSSASSGKSK